jgi:hypothetical protein
MLPLVGELHQLSDGLTVLAEACDGLLVLSHSWNHCDGHLFLCGLRQHDHQLATVVHQLCGAC